MLEMQGVAVCDLAHGLRSLVSVVLYSIIPAMAKDKTIYTCNECGGTSPKWLGKCPHCNAWNTLIESVASSDGPAKNRFASLAKTAEVTVLSDIEAQDVERTPTGHEELDRVLGGGMVEGGVVLIGGDPGIGKSTLLLLSLIHI
jgi:DNA repair protein RadA/Sms